MDSTNFAAKITPAASADLRDITDYIANDLKNIPAAEKLWADLIEGIDNAAMYPYSMPVIRNAAITKSTEYRKILVRNYVALYKIYEEKKEIVIMRIYYAPSNLIDLF